ncbi:MAG: hypothetical protein ACFFD1_00575 [Candidatus Thorarchaeota archaeon]
MRNISRRTQKRLKEAFYIIASHFSSYFQDQVLKQSGYRPKDINFHSLDPVAIVGRHRKLHLFEVNFSSEMGFHKSKLAIKVFDNLDKVLQEATGNQILRSVLEGQSEIQTPQLLYYSKEYQLIVYEGLYAEEFENFKLAENDKFYFAGRSLGSVHNRDLKNVDLQRYYTFIDKIFTILFEKYTKLIPKNTLELIRDRLVQEIEERLFYCYGGSRSFGDFHPGNIMFGRGEDKEKNKIKIFLIDPEFIEDCIETPCVDRFEDIGTFFAKIGLEEYVRTNGSLINTKKIVKSFLNGYNSKYEDIKVRIEHIYPRGKSLEFQMILAIMFDVLYYLNREENNDWLKQMVTARLAYINTLFMHPFDILD